MSLLCLHVCVFRELRAENFISNKLEGILTLTLNLCNTLLLNSYHEYQEIKGLNNVQKLGKRDSFA